MSEHKIHITHIVGFISPDADPRNADWTKRTWNIDAHNIEDLRALLKQDNTTIEQFKSLPVYGMNVNKPGMEWLKEL